MPIWKTKYGWRADFKHKGRRIMARGTFRLKRDAEQWVKTEKKKYKDLHESTSTVDLSLWKLSQRYLADREQSCVKKTIGEKKSCLERFYAAMGDVMVTDITPLAVLDFLSARADSQSNHAANKDRKNLKSFFAWVRKYAGVMHDPTALIEKKPHSKSQRRLIPIEDILKVMLAAEGQDRVMLAAYWHTGGRRGEIFRWTWAEDVNFEGRWVRLGTRKGRTGEMKYEKLWMNDDLYRELQWQWKHRHPSSPFVFVHRQQTSLHYGEPFTTRRRLLKGLCKRAGVDEFGFHDIRHTVAKYLNDLQKVGLKKVQQVLRHRRQTTTEIYLEGNYSDTKDALTLLELRNVETLSSGKSTQKSTQKETRD